MPPHAPMHACNSYTTSQHPAGCDIDNGLGYRGTAAVTVGGVVCQKWSAVSPHSHGFTDFRCALAGM